MADITIKVGGATITSTGYNNSTGLVGITILLPSGVEYYANTGNLATKSQRLIDSGAVTNPGDIAALRAVINQSSSIVAEIDAANPPDNPAQPQPPATASQTAQDDAPKGPNAPGTTTAPNTEAPTVAETGTNGRLRPTTETQATTTESNSGNATPATDMGEIVVTGKRAVLKPGTPTNDDNANESTTTKQTQVNAASNVKVKVAPRPNVLDEFYSYTYTASVYLLTEAQFARLLKSTTKKVNGYQLLFQSGGAPNNVGGVKNPPTTAADDAVRTTDAGRNPYFENDFYIDSITLDHQLQGKGTGAAHATTALKFTVVEPNGITLLDRLYDAVANSAPRSADGKVNYTAATYLMVIRFYGYNQDGTQVQVKGPKPDAAGTSDPGAVTEKFIPFRIDSIDWTISNRMANYEWKCSPVSIQIAASTARATVPYDVQLVDSTVGGLLGGATKYTSGAITTANPGGSNTTDQNQSNAETRRLASANQAAAPSKVNAAPTNKTTITQGLIGAMNEFQQKLVRDGVQKYADQYEIVFKDPAIRDAKLQLANSKVVKRLTASGQPATKNAKNLDQDRTSVDNVTRSFSITAGQPLLQAIELAIRNSSYIYDQALVILNPDGSFVPNPNARNQPLKWYNISMNAEPISPDLDPKRNDYAYKITYIVQPFVVKNFNSQYFPISQFSGVHKSYPYWFTGQNTSVIDYKESMNALFQLTISGSDSAKSNANITRDKFTSSMSDIVKYAYSPRSTESSQGAAGKENELGANAAEVLYSPSDLREVKLRILGDPAWIRQGSMVQDVSNNEFTSPMATGFENDGSISFDTQDVLFEIAWQRPEDYDLGTGLADPFSATQKKYNNRTALQSRVYAARTCVSEFKQGSFEQVLDGVLYQFPVPDRTNTANPAAANQSDAETQRLARQNAGVNSPANATTGTAARTGVPLTPEAAAQARAAFASTDERRKLVTDSAAGIGAQQAVPVPSLGTTGQGGADGGAETQQSTWYDAEPEPVVAVVAGPPEPPSSGTGGDIESTVSTNTPKLPAAGGGNLTPEQVESIRTRAINQALAENPTSTLISSNQIMNKEA